MLDLALRLWNPEHGILPALTERIPDLVRILAHWYRINSIKCVTVQ